MHGKTAADLLTELVAVRVVVEFVERDGFEQLPYANDLPSRTLDGGDAPALVAVVVRGALGTLARDTILFGPLRQGRV